MFKKSEFTKGLIGLDYEAFLDHCEGGKESSIAVREARLIPLLKTGDEGALTSIFLSSLRLIKEYRDSIFKEIKLPRGGKAYYFSEVTFKHVDASCRIDGLIIVVVNKKIKDAVGFEMKNKNNPLEKGQIEKYISVLKKIGVSKMVTVSNDFVSDSSQSPIKLDKSISKNFDLFHFSWTYLMTKGQILLFKNETNIEDEDQVEIMKEVLHYIDAPASGVSGYHKMKDGWNKTVGMITDRRPLKIESDEVVQAIESWHEEERDMALLLSRELGVFVKSTPRLATSITEDAKRLKSNFELFGNLSIKNSVSDIKIRLDFEVKTVSMSVKVIPPQDKGTKARITWITKQLENAKKKNEEVFNQISNDLLLEVDVKHARQHIRVPLTAIDSILDETNGREIQAFNVVLMSKFKAKFESNKGFIVEIEKMVLEYYAGIVQYLTNWNRPAPKL
ncbi:MAG: hypothetical protein ISP71_08615 [Flavobacteriales bacterium]|nr:hypothetical protein [Flavobacteriales bacterium]